MRGVTLVVVLSLGIALSAQAQEIPRGIAEYEQAVAVADIEDGDLMVLTESGLDRAAERYDQRLAGVVSRQPAVVFSTVGRDNAIPVVRQGSTHVRVNTSEGAIAVGDWITTSEVPGEGVKATEPGYAVGRALAAFTGEAGVVGLVPVNVDIQFAIPENKDAPPPFTLAGAVNTVQTGFRVISGGAVHFSVRYTIAGLVVITSAIFGYWIISRATTTGIAAIGRNPLARGTIIVTTGMTLTAALAIIAGGVAFAIFILAL